MTPDQLTDFIIDSLWNESAFVSKMLGYTLTISFKGREETFYLREQWHDCRYPADSRLIKLGVRRTKRILDTINATEYFLKLPNWKPRIDTESGPDRTHEQELEKEVARLRAVNLAAFEASAEPWREDLSLEGHYDAGRKYVHEAMWKAHREWEAKN